MLTVSCKWVGLYNSDEYKKKLSYMLKNSKNKRDKIVTSALFLSTQFDKIPYFWGGFHEKKISEIDIFPSEFGIIKPILYSGSQNYIVGDKYPYSFDCSSFVCWCLINAGIKLEHMYSTKDLYKMGNIVDILDKNLYNTIQLGDLAYMNGHIGVIVNTNRKKHEIIVVHVSFSGEGINITTIDTTTGLIIKDDLGICKNKINRCDTKYFNKVIHLNLRRKF